MWCGEDSELTCSGYLDTCVEFAKFVDRVDEAVGHPTDETSRTGAQAERTWIHGVGRLIHKFQRVTGLKLADCFRGTVKMPDAAHEEQHGKSAIAGPFRVCKDFDPVGRSPTFATNEHSKGIRLDVESKTLEEVLVVGPASGHEPVVKDREELMALVDVMQFRQPW